MRKKKLGLWPPNWNLKFQGALFSSPGCERKNTNKTKMKAKIEKHTESVLMRIEEMFEDEYQSTFQDWNSGGGDGKRSKYEADIVLAKVEQTMYLRARFRRVLSAVLFGK